VLFNCPGTNRAHPSGGKAVGAIIKRRESYILFPICFHGAVPNTWLTLSSRYIVRERNENRCVQTSKTRGGEAKCMQNDGRKNAKEQAIY
jgi:hypothetical protein